MNIDARITLYGGTGVALALVAIGMLASSPPIGITGCAFAGLALGMALVMDHFLPSNPTPEAA